MLICTYYSKLADKQRCTQWCDYYLQCFSIGISTRSFGNLTQWIRLPAKTSGKACVFGTIVGLLKFQCPKREVSTGLMRERELFAPGFILKWMAVSASASVRSRKHEHLDFKLRSCSTPPFKRAYSSEGYVCIELIFSCRWRVSQKATSICVAGQRARHFFVRLHAIVHLVKPYTIQALRGIVCNCCIAIWPLDVNASWAR